MSKPTDSGSSRLALGRFIRNGTFRRVWMVASLSQGATIGSYVIISWLASQAGSAIDVGLAVAMRTLPSAVLGVPAGMLVDRVSRRRVLLVSQLALGSTMMAAAFVASGFSSMPMILLLAAAIGALDALRGVATQTYVYDVVGHRDALRGIATTNFGMQLLGAVAGIATGIALAATGAAGSLALVGGTYFVGAAAIVGSTLSVKSAGAEHDRKATGGTSSIIAACLANELLGFSSVVLLPAFAIDVFNLGPAALGGLYAARSIGGAIGLSALAWTSFRAGRHTVWAVSLVFGLGLMGFAVTPWVVAGFAFSLVIGGASSTVDALVQTLLQHSVADRRRGMSMGLWYVCLGFGPVGHVELGFLADVLGPQPAQALNAALLIAVSIPPIARRRRPARTSGRPC